MFMEIRFKGMMLVAKRIFNALCVLMLCLFLLPESAAAAAASTRKQHHPRRGRDHADAVCHDRRITERNKKGSVTLPFLLSCHRCKTVGIMPGIPAGANRYTYSMRREMASAAAFIRATAGSSSWFSSRPGPETLMAAMTLPV